MNLLIRLSWTFNRRSFFHLNFLAKISKTTPLSLLSLLVWILLIGFIPHFQLFKVSISLFSNPLYFLLQLFYSSNVLFLTFLEVVGLLLLVVFLFRWLMRTLWTWFHIVYVVILWVLGLVGIALTSKRLIDSRVLLH